MAALRARLGVRGSALALSCFVALAFASTPAAALLAPTTVTVTASANPSPHGSPVTFTATVTSGAGTPDGTIIFLSDLVSLGVGTLDGAGRATFTSSTLPIGVHAIVAVYVGNLNYATSTSIGLNINITLAACTITVTASINPIIFGTTVSLTATVTGSGGTPTGNVTFRAGVTVLGNVPVGSGGQAVMSTSALLVGLLSISADYSGDGLFLPCIAPIIIITVNKSPTTSTVTSSSNPSNAGAPVTLTATVTGPGGTPTGSVTFKDGAAVIGTGTLGSSGQAALTTSALRAGNHSITATYIGDTNFLGSTSPNFTQTINQGASTTSLVSSPNPAALNSPVTFMATVAGGGAIPTGTVTFKDGVNTIGTGTLSAAGQATVSTSALALGTHSITAVYGGDANFTGSSASALAQVIVSSTSATALTAAPNPATVGAPVVLAASVTGTGGTPTGSVTFKDGAATLGTVSVDSSGRASLTSSTLTAGTHSLTAVYGGDATFAASTSPAVSVQINAAGGGTTSATALTATPNPATVGAPVTLNATVSGAGGTPTGTVTFKDGASTIGTGTLNASGGTVLITSSLAAGAHSVTAVYGGDATFAASTSAAVSVQVNAGSGGGGATSTTALTATPNPGTAGAPVTFNATVSGAGGTPTGTVTFKDGATTIGTGTLNASGGAILVTSSLSAGTHAVTAVYGGDATFAGSSSSIFAFVVGPAATAATATTVASSANPGIANQPVTFTANVIAPSGSPTGTVTFRDAGQVIGTAVLAGGSASMTTSSLRVGSHPITASYGGDAGFASSVSAPLAQAIAVPADSMKLRSVQILTTRIAAQNSGQAIAGAIDAAIDEGFSDGDQMLAPSELGLRLSSSGYDRQANGRGAPARRSDWVVWSDLRHTSMTADSARQEITGNQANALAGLTYRGVPDILVGIFGGYESFNYDVASLNGHLRGDGWTAGGYAAASFPGSRTLLTTALTGVYRFLPGVELEPSARIYALWEKEDAFRDSLGTSQSERNFSAGRASVGAKLTYRWAVSGTTAIAPFAGVYTDNYFNKDDADAVSVPAAMAGTSMRVLGGMAVTTDYGLKFSSTAELGGLGGNFMSWTVRARGSVPF